MPRHAVENTRRTGSAPFSFGNNSNVKPLQKNGFISFLPPPASPASRQHHRRREPAAPLPYSCIAHRRHLFESEPGGGIQTVRFLRNRSPPAGPRSRIRSARKESGIMKSPAKGGAFTALNPGLSELIRTVRTPRRLPFSHPGQSSRERRQSAPPGQKCRVPRKFPRKKACRFQWFHTESG